jgi:hypothetical protein
MEIDTQNSICFSTVEMRKSSLNTHSNEEFLSTKASWATGISCYAPTKKGKEKLTQR